MPAGVTTPSHSDPSAIDPTGGPSVHWNWAAEPKEGVQHREKNLVTDGSAHDGSAHGKPWKTMENHGKPSPDHPRKKS